MAIGQRCAVAKRFSFRDIIDDAARVLTFRAPSPAIALHSNAYLAFGLGMTWLAGMGRYWDNPRAEVWQHLGLGSVIYVVLLGLFLWAIAAPLRPNKWSYRNVLIFVCLTSPPALLYAIPVERFMSLEMAQTANATFLATVASWRVALLLWFLRRFGGLGWSGVWVASLLPLTIIVVALTLFNLEHVAFQLMAGIRPDERSANDTAFLIVSRLALISSLLVVPLLIAYAILVFRARWKAG